MIKKLKGLRTTKKPESEIQDCEAQLEALKTTDHHAAGSTVFYSKIKKDKVLAQHDAVKSAVESKLADTLLAAAPAGSPTAKVHARLLSSKTLAAEAASAVQALRALVQPPTEVENVEGRDNEEEAEVKDAPAQQRKLKKVKTSQQSQAASAGPTPGNDNQAAEADGWESGTVDEDGDGWESGTVDGGDSDAGDSDADERPPPKKAKPATPAAAGVAGSSQFLPSLAVGFIPGSDDSDVEEIEDKPKKNRRGQRARQAIWEKKYGRNANHKQKERDVAQEKRRQWEERAQKRAAAAAAWEQRERIEAQVQARPLHPSWEAKKKLKDKEAAIVPSQGKKLVFS